MTHGGHSSRRIALAIAPLLALVTFAAAQPVAHADPGHGSDPDPSAWCDRTRPDENASDSGHDHANDRNRGWNCDQTVTWSPQTVTIPNVALSGATTNPVTTSISYAVDPIATNTAGCTIAGSGLLSSFQVARAGQCTVIATASWYWGRHNHLLNVETASSLVTVRAAVTPPPPPPAPVAQSVTWTPRTVFYDIDSPVRLSAARTSGNGFLYYSVVNSGSAGCVVHGFLGLGRGLSFDGPGTCVLRATASATPQYLAGSTTVTITVLKAMRPSAVNDLRVVGHSDGQITVAWDRPSYSGTHPIVRYRIRIRERHHEPYELVGVTRPGVRTFTIEDVAPGTYYVRVRAVNAAGAGADSVVGPIVVS